MSETQTYDVVVIGSGSAAASATLRAADLGLSVLMVEKAAKFGGTSATSGGVLWLPNNQLTPNDDSREEAMEYLSNLMRSDIQQDRLDAFLDTCPALAKYLKTAGIPVQQAAWPDYFAGSPGARADRSVVVDTFDGRELGDHFIHMREQFSRFKVFNRYAMDVMEFFSLSTRTPGWVKTFTTMFWRYWSDISTRVLTSRDRRCTQGGALMGHLFKQIFDRGVAVRLDTKLEALITDDGQVTGVTVSNFGRRYDIMAKHGVVMGAGGFEWNQALRDRYLKVPGSTRWSSSPEDANRGEALLAGLKAGADTEHTDACWWIPTMHKPMPKASNFTEIHQAAFDVGRPHSVCVNRNGDRFVDEACSYDEFGEAMVKDQLATGANTPCWLIFDAQFRKLFTAGGFMPSLITPDWAIPKDYWDHYIFKADTVETLATKIHLPADKLKTVVHNMNQYARTGKDTEFGRGDTVYDQMFGHHSATPNPCLALINKAPYYAVPIHLGDLGTKGGLKCDAKGRVMNTNGEPIAGLYAAGNNSGSPFGNLYPGAGGTIGPAMVFGYLAANDIAERAGKLDGTE